MYTVLILGTGNRHFYSVFDVAIYIYIYISYIWSMLGTDLSPFDINAANTHLAVNFTRDRSLFCTCVVHIRSLILSYDIQTVITLEYKMEEIRFTKMRINGGILVHRTTLKTHRFGYHIFRFNKLIFTRSFLCNGI